MNDLLNLIYSRRSIRKYTADKVPEDLIKVILSVGMAAPSAGNQQPWEFIVVDDRETMEEITRIHDASEMLKKAPVCIVVCGNLDKLRYPDEWWVQDCAAATQNMLLAIQALGLGAVWLGVHPRVHRIKGLQKLFGLPEQVIPVAIISLGYPAEEKRPKGEYREEMVHRNKW